MSGEGRSSTPAEEDAVSVVSRHERRFELLKTTFEARGSDPGWFFWLLSALLLGVSIWVAVLFVRVLAA